MASSTAGRSSCASKRPNRLSPAVKLAAVKTLETALWQHRCNSRLKVLAWDRDGFVLWYKGLEAGCSNCPASSPVFVPVGDKQPRRKPEITVTPPTLLVQEAFPSPRSRFLLTTRSGASRPRPLHLCSAFSAGPLPIEICRHPVDNSAGSTQRAARTI